MNRSAVLLLAATGLFAWLLASGSAVAASPKPNGTYGGVGTLACVTAAGGFDANFQPNTPANASTSTGNGLAVYTFKKNGTGTVSFNNVTVGLAGGSSSHGTNIPFTYVSNGHGGLTLTAGNSTFTGTIDNGPRATQTFTIDNWTVDAYIAQGNKAIVTATAAPFVENITFSGTNPGPFPRICARETTLMPIPPNAAK